MKKSHIGAIVGFTIMSYFAIALYGVLAHHDCDHDHSDPIQPKENIQTVDTTVTNKVDVKAVAPKPSVDSLVYAMIQVESKGNDSAYCAVEKAVGCLQIRPIMVSEVNRICKLLGIKKTYTLQDRWSREKSIQMLKIFTKFYQLEDFEEIARCWNGGPSGMTYASTNIYWTKVQEELL
tara:strand:+ start:51 stop:584 length:534 start_codon:yes stop_codon:yes gene_type:complete